MSNPLDHQLTELGALKPPELRARWREVYRAAAPDIGPDLLRRGIAYRLQERGRGSVTPASRRVIDRLIRQLGKANGTLVNSPAALKPGTRLVRSWRGKTHQVLVLDDGFEFDGRCYASLSQIASNITGAHWSGPRFFGLVSRGKGNEA